MLRSEFDDHPLWVTIDGVKTAVDQLVEEHEAPELPSLELVKFYASYAESFRELATTSSSLFSTAMLDPVKDSFEQVLEQLNVRIQEGIAQTAYVNSAAAAAESALIPMGPWPRPFGKGGQVTQMSTLYEDLLEAQRQSIAALNALHEDLRNEVSSLSSEAATRQKDVYDEVAALQEQATGVSDVVTSEKGRIDEVVAQGLKAVSSIETSSAESYKAWQAERASQFDKDFSPLRAQIEADLKSAAATLDELKSTNEQFVNLSTIAANDVMARSFRSEARWGRITGIVLYIFGAAFLAGAAVPLVFLLFDPNIDSTEGPRWGLIFVRLAIGVLAGSAATVMIRLGGRLIANADLSKRMELELKAIGPFLANVVDTGTVDKARLDFVKRAFGKSYAGAKAEDDPDTVSTSLITQLFDALLRTQK